MFGRDSDATGMDGLTLAVVQARRLQRPRVQGSRFLKETDNDLPSLLN